MLYEVITNGKDLSIVADEQTNALVITAQPDIMQELERIIGKLDIRRAQVLVEAVIVEMQDRITSYNVCYTKLLRHDPTIRS